MDGLPIAAAFLGLALALFVASRPVAASLGMYAFLLPFDSILIPGQIGRIHLHLTWFAGAAAAVILLTAGLLGKRFVRPPRAALWLSLIIFWAAMSSLWAINADSAVFRLPLLALLLLLYLLAVSIRVSEKELATIAWLAVLGACLAAAITLYAFSRGEWWVPPEAQQVRHLSGRVTLSAGDRVTDPNILGATLILPLSLAIGQLLSSRTWGKRLLLMGLLAVIGVSICATMSRGTLVATVVIFTVYLWRSRARWRVLLPIAVLGMLVLAMPQVFFLRLAGAFADRGAGRVDVWEVGLRAFSHYPILGAGLDCFPDAYDQYVQTASNFVGFSRGPHNIYLGMSVELGVIGLLLLLSTVKGHIGLVAKALRSDSDESSRMRLISYEAACWGLLASGIFLDILWEGYFWLILMLIVMSVRARDASREAAYRRLVYPFRATGKREYPVGEVRWSSSNSIYNK